MTPMNADGFQKFVICVHRRNLRIISLFVLLALARSFQEINALMARSLKFSGRFHADFSIVFGPLPSSEFHDTCVALA
jgi:hypothetical protein